MPEKFPGHALNLSCRLLRKLNTIKKKIDSTAILKLKRLDETQPNTPSKSNQLKDIEDITIVRSGCPFFYGFSGETEKD